MKVLSYCRIKIIHEAPKERAEAFLARGILRMDNDKRGGICTVADNKSRNPSTDKVGVDPHDSRDDADAVEFDPAGVHKWVVRQRGLHDCRRRNPGWREGALPVVAVLVAFMVDREMRDFSRVDKDKALLSANFESNPLLSKWSNVGSGSEWTDGEQVSGRRSIAFRDSIWASPFRQTELLQWYRLTFRSKAPGASKNALCAVVFADANGEEIHSNLELTVQKSIKWIKSDFRFRAHPMVDSAGNLSAAAIRVEFLSEDTQLYYVDEFVLAKTSATEVGEWADRLYAMLPAKLNYLGKETRWRRLQGTMEKLRSHQSVRIVVLGNETQEDIGNAPLDVFLKRLYPGCIVEVVPSIQAGANMGFFKDRMEEYVMRLKPDLLIVGGVSSRDEMLSLQSIVDQIRAKNALSRCVTEIMLVANGWSANDVGDDGFRLRSDMRELDQEPGNNFSVPDDFRGHLMRFAAENNIEFVDMMGIVSEYVFGSAGVASVGPSTGADGVPYSYWSRDWMHRDESRRQIIGKILEAYFSPSGIGTKTSRQAARETKSVPIRLFDPERSPRDQETYAAINRVFGANTVDRPALALNFGGDLGSGNGLTAASSAPFRVGGRERLEIGYSFDDPLDVRSGDVVVYWSFRTNRMEGDDKGSLKMHLCFTDPLAGGREDRSQITLTVRPGGTSVLSIGGGMAQEIEHLVEAPVENFKDASKAAKFRLILRWVGGDRVVAEAASWNSRENRWDGFIPFDRPGAPALAMELSIANHLLGTPTFKSLHFEAQSTVPVLEAALVTIRPSMIR